MRKCFVVFWECKIKSKRFEDYVSRLCQLMSLRDVARVAEIDWKTDKRIDKKYLSRLVTGLESISPTKLGVDEIAYHKGHKYLTVVRDLTLGRVIWVGMGRKKETLDTFFKELGKKKCRKIKVVVLDVGSLHSLSQRKH